jgi:hypothetical protein
MRQSDHRSSAGEIAHAGAGARERRFSNKKHVCTNVSFRISLCRIHHPPPAARIPAAQRWGDANCLGHFNLTCPQPKLLLLCRYLHKQVSTLAPHSSDCFIPELQPKSRLQTVKGARPTWVFDVAAAGVEMPSSSQSSGGQPGDSQGGPRINGTSTRARNDPHLSI